MAHGDEEVGMILPPPVELKLSSSQKVTVRTCRSRRCLHLSDLGSPDIGRGKKNEANDWRGTPNGSGGSLPLSGSKIQKRKFFEQRWWQTDDSHFTPG